MIFPLNRIGFTVCVFSFVLVLIIIVISEAKSSLINVASIEHCCPTHSVTSLTRNLISKSAFV